MKNTVHFNNILKRVVNRLMETMSIRECDILANAPDSELAKWFNKTAMAQATAKFESTTYWMNEKDSFTYSAHEPLVPIVPVVIAPVVAPAPKVSKRAKNKARKQERELVEA